MSGFVSTPPPLFFAALHSTITPPPADDDSSYSNPFTSMGSMIYSNAVVVLSYALPPAPAVHQSRLLLGAVPAPPALESFDLLILRRPRLNRAGFNICDILHSMRNKNRGGFQKNDNNYNRHGGFDYNHTPQHNFVQTQHHPHQQLQQQGFGRRGDVPGAYSGQGAWPPQHQQPYQQYHQQQQPYQKSYSQSSASSEYQQTTYSQRDVRSHQAHGPAPQRGHSNDSYSSNPQHQQHQGSYSHNSSYGNQSSFGHQIAAKAFAPLRSDPSNSHSNGYGDGKSYYEANRQSSLPPSTGSVYRDRAPPVGSSTGFPHTHFSLPPQDSTLGGRPGSRFQPAAPRQPILQYPQGYSSSSSSGYSHHGSQPPLQHHQQQPQQHQTLSSRPLNPYAAPFTLPLQQQQQQHNQYSSRYTSSSSNSNSNASRSGEAQSGSMQSIRDQLLQTVSAVKKR